jgi:hypothetical protein
MKDDSHASRGSRVVRDHPLFQYFDNCVRGDVASDLVRIVDCINAFYDRELFLVETEEDELACVCSLCRWKHPGTHSIAELTQADRRPSIPFQNHQSPRA